MILFEGAQIKKPKRGKIFKGRRKNELAVIQPTSINDKGQSSQANYETDMDTVPVYDEDKNTPPNKPETDQEYKNPPGTPRDDYYNTPPPPGTDPSEVREPGSPEKPEEGSDGSGSKGDPTKDEEGSGDSPKDAQDNKKDAKKGEDGGDGSGEGEFEEPEEGDPSGSGGEKGEEGESGGEATETGNEDDTTPSQASSNQGTISKKEDYSKEVEDFIDKLGDVASRQNDPGKGKLKGDEETEGLPPHITPVEDLDGEEKKTANNMIKNAVKEYVEEAKKQGIDPKDLPSLDDIVGSLGAGAIEKAAKFIKGLDGKIVGSGWEALFQEAITKATGIEERRVSYVPSRKFEGQLSGDIDFPKLDTVVVSVDCSSSMGPKKFKRVFNELKGIAKEFGHLFEDVDIYSYIWAGASSLNARSNDPTPYNPGMVKRYIRLQQGGFDEKTFQRMASMPVTLSEVNETDITATHLGLFRCFPDEIDLLIMLTDAGDNGHPTASNFNKVKRFFRELGQEGKIIWGLVKDPDAGKHHIEVVRDYMGPYYKETMIKLPI